ncbi:MAG TPA: GxxExxY protein, partial [Anaerolineales bacterium]|nr:GxxExxY protein [Anaerolineales bacterium]
MPEQVIIEKELSYLIMQVAFEVHNELGPGYPESIYEEAMNRELARRGVQLERQKVVEVFFKGEKIGSFQLDNIANGKIILEYKAVSEIARIHKQQALSYLKRQDSSLQLSLILERSARSPAVSSTQKGKRNFLSIYCARAIFYPTSNKKYSRNSPIRYIRVKNRRLMKSDIDALMQARNLDALIVFGNAEHNPPMYYFTGGGHVSHATIIKKRGEEPIYFHADMERDEAAKSGLKRIPYTKYDFDELYKKANKDSMLTSALRYELMFKDAGVASGRVGVYGTYDISLIFGMLTQLQKLMPN